MSKTLEEITQTAETLARYRGNMAAILGSLEAGMNALKADAMPALRDAMEQAAIAWKSIEADIQANPQLFVRPRTVSAHGIKFGLKRSTGSIEIADPDKTVALIEKHFPERADLLIDTVKKPCKDAIGQLTVAEMKRIGANAVGAGDQVVIAPADGVIDKLLKALMKDAIAQQDEPA